MRFALNDRGEDHNVFAGDMDPLQPGQRLGIASVVVLTANGTQSHQVQGSCAARSLRAQHRPPLFVPVIGQDDAPVFGPFRQIVRLDAPR